MTIKTKQLIKPLLIIGLFGLIPNNYTNAQNSNISKTQTCENLQQELTENITKINLYQTNLDKSQEKSKIKEAELSKVKSNLEYNIEKLKSQREILQESKRVDANQGMFIQKSIEYTAKQTLFSSLLLTKRQSELEKTITKLTQSQKVIETDLEELTITHYIQQDSYDTKCK
jgi:hypothetical protein